MNRMRILGIENVLGEKIDDAGLRSIAEEISLRSDLTSEAIVDRFKTLLSQRILVSLLSDTDLLLKTLNRVLQAPETGPYQSAFQLIAPIDSTLESLQEFPSSFGIHGEINVGILVASLLDTKTQIESFAKLNDQERQTQWPLLLTGPLNKAKTRLTEFRGNANQKSTAPVERIKYELFADDGLRNEYAKIVLDSLETEDGDLTLRELTKELIYFVALNSKTPPSFLDSAVNEIQSKKGVVAAGATAGVMAIGEAVASLFGYTTGGGILAAGATSLAFHAGKRLKKFNEEKGLWVIAQMREIFNIQFAIPLGFSASRNHHEFNRAQTLLCGAALENAKRHL